MHRRLVVAVLAVTGSLLAAAPARAVSGVQVDNSSPTRAAGAQTVYRVTFTTGATLTRADSDAMTLQLPTGTTFAGYSGTAVYDLDSATPTTSIGSCGGATGLTITCGLNFNQSIAGGHRVQVVLNGIANPPAGSPHVTVSTSKEPTAVDSAPYTVVAANPVTQVAVDNTSPSTAAGAQTVYAIGFTASATGGIARDANSQIKLVLPNGTTFAGYSGTAVYDLDSATPTTSIGSCGGAVTLTITCGLNFNQSIPPGHRVRVVLNGIANPGQGSPHVTVSTTSDPASVDSANYTVVAANPVTQVTVDNATPSSAAGAQTVYAIAFTASATGGISRDANSQIKLVLPNGTTFAGYSGTAVYDLDNATPTTSIGSCGGAVTLTITCGLNFNQAIPAGHHVKVVLNGIANPGQGSPHVTVSTTSDPATVNSADYTVVAANPVTQVTVQNTMPSAAAGARTVYAITFVASATGGIARDANSQIKLVFPSGTTFAGYSGTAVYDLDGATPTTSIGSCGGAVTLTITCGLNFNRSIPAGHHVQVVLNGIGNPGQGSQHVAVSTTSDPASVDSANYGVVAAQTLSQVSVAVGSGSGSAFTQYTIEFATSEFGGLSRDANSAISLVFPAGTTLSAYNGSAVFDLTAGGPSIGSCGGPTGLTVTCGFSFGQSVPSGHRVRVTLNNVGNPPTAGDYRVNVATTSDQAAESGPYGVGAGATATPTPEPTVSPTPQPAVSPTPTPTPPPAPEFHKDVVVAPVSGKVTVRRPGTNQFVELDSAADIPLGSTIDVKAGRLQLSSVPKPGAPAQTATFYAGVFKITQPGGITQLQLNEPLAPCAKRGHASAAKKKPKTRRLWGEGNGAFRTRGQYSAATVRGTKWLVQDSCAGTLTRVVKGAVSVRDDVRRKTVLVRAGHRYLAKPRH